MKEIYVLVHHFKTGKKARIACHSFIPHSDDWPIYFIDGGLTFSLSPLEFEALSVCCENERLSKTDIICPGQMFEYFGVAPQVPGTFVF